MVAFQFESPQDPYGLQSAGNILSQVLLQRGQENRQQRKQQQQSGIVGKILQESMQKNLTPQQTLEQLYSANVSPEILNPLLKIYEPQLKEQARLQGIRQFQQDVLGYKTGNAPEIDFQTSQLVSPERNFQQEMLEEKLPSNAPANQIDFPLSDRQIEAYLASPYPELQRLAQFYADRKKEASDRNEKRFYEDRRFNTEQSKQISERSEKLRESLPRKRNALRFAKDAVLSGDVDQMSLANLAKRTGIEEFQTAKGAQLVTAGKENLISNLSNLAARAQNLWIEQRFSSMFPLIGQSEEANLTTAALLDSELELDQSWLNAYDRLAQKDMEDLGYVRADIGRRIDEDIKDEEKNILDKTSYEIRQIYEQEKGRNWLTKNALKKVPSGTFLTPTMFSILSKKYDGDVEKTIENAKKLGYSIPSKNQYERWL